MIFEILIFEQLFKNVTALLFYREYYLINMEQHSNYPKVPRNAPPCGYKLQPVQRAPLPELIIDTFIQHSCAPVARSCNLAFLMICRCGMLSSTFSPGTLSFVTRKPFARQKKPTSLVSRLCACQKRLFQLITKLPCAWRNILLCMELAT